MRPRTAVTAESSGRAGQRLATGRRQPLERLVGDDVVGLHGPLEDLRERARSDEANTAAALTRATPIISAAAVADVRRGARPAFSLASLPGRPKTLATGQPISLVTGRATVDETLATPRKINRPPPPARVSRPIVPPGRANRPSTNITAPTSVTRTPATSRLLLMASKPSSGRIAATGGILAARRAGMITESSVMPTPTRTATTIVRGSSTVSLSGKPIPAELKRR